MSNVSKTNAEVIDKNRKLWLDTRDVPVITTTKNGEANAIRWGWTEAKAVAADALAARVPVQGEPNDDREALRDEFRSYLGDEIYVSSRDHSAWEHGTMGLDDFSLAAEDDEIVESLVQIASRTTVPDAATGRFECDRSCVGMNEPIEDCSAHGRTPRDLWDRLDELVAERDAALAAIERVRAIHYETEGVHCHTVCAHRYCKDDSEDQHRWPCPTVAALDGAPEPEWEWGVRHVKVDGWVDYQAHPSRADAEDDYRTCGMNCAVVRRRKAGPWEPIKGESE